MAVTEDKWLVIVNPHAGSGKTTSVWEKAEAVMREMDIPFEEKRTGFRYHARELSYHAAVQGYRKIMPVGGDGTVHDVLDGIMRFIGEAEQAGKTVSLEDFYLAIIPIGSGNDWIRIHNIDHDLYRTVSLIRQQSFILQDVIQVSTLDELDPVRAMTAPPTSVSYMINIGGIAFDARICERVNCQKKLGKRGKFLYVNSLIYNLFHFEPLPMSVWADGQQVHDGECLSIAFGNGRYSGGGLLQTPLARFDDGLLEMTLFPPFSRWRILAEARRLFDGTILEVGEVVSAQARSILVLPRSERREIVEVDGEIVGNVPVRMDVMPSRIHVLHSF